MDCEKREAKDKGNLGRPTPIIEVLDKAEVARDVDDLDRIYVFAGTNDAGQQPSMRDKGWAKAERDGKDGRARERESFPARDRENLRRSQGKKGETTDTRNKPEASVPLDSSRILT